MFNRPNVHDSDYLIADYIEYICVLTESSVSSSDLRSLFSISDDEIDNDGVESADDASIDRLEDAISVCRSRSLMCPDRYPFEHHRIELTNKTIENQYKEIYLFLLFATRCNMNTQRVQNGVDATKIFEELCAEVAHEYFGGRSKFYIFGTASETNFSEKVEDLIRKIHLDFQFNNPNGSTGRQKDGSLDIVAWIPFPDNKDGQLIAMGQCKTGDSWESKLTELQPSAFFKSYCTGAPCADPIRMFFVSESFGNYKWTERCNKGGILFDRMRIMSFLPPQIPVGLMSKITRWNQGAILTGRQSLL